MKYLFLILFFCACSDAPTMKPRDINEYYQNSGVLNYYLSEIPLWASFSTSGKCFHKQSTAYIDLQKIQDSFGLSFGDGLQLQLQLNLLRNFKHKTLKVEEQFFYDSLEKIRAKFYPFKTNDFEVANVVWFEGHSDSDFNKIAHSNTLNSAPVIFLSLCLSHQALNKKLETLNLSYQYQTLSVESMTIFNENVAMPYWQIPLKAWIGEKKKINFFSKEPIPSEIKEAVIWQK